MALCNHCKRKFQSSQAVKAHLKHCSCYQTTDGKKSRALGSKPKAESTPNVTPPFHPAHKSRSRICPSRGASL
jgi:hypothetical protein